MFGELSSGILFCRCPSLSLAPAEALKAAIHFADRPPCSASADFHLKKTDALLLSEPAWHLLNRASRSAADSAIWRDGRRHSPMSGGSDCPSTLSVMCCLPHGAELLCSRSRQPRMVFFYFMASWGRGKCFRSIFFFFMVATQVLLSCWKYIRRTKKLMFCLVLSGDLK